MVKNAYIHIPFCKSKCKYCSFVSFPALEQKDEYIKSLNIEISNRYKKETLNTLYIGGGTPSTLNIADFKSIIANFNINSNTEVTVELNPEHLNVEYMQELRNLNINRMSLGCQTFDDEILKQIGRRHNSQNVINAVKSAQIVGFENISLDFIYGLPNQTEEIFINDLKTAIELGVKHVSLYGLKIDEGCYFHEHVPENIADDDRQASMYLSAIKLMSENDFKHYEISNFAKTGCESRHNLNYWDNNSYYGFGVAAHGYENKIRYSNTDNLEDYIKNPLKHKSETILDSHEILEEEIFLGFRKGNGICIKKINEKFGIDFEKKFFNVLKKYTETGHLVKTLDGYKLSDEGFLVSNLILSEFIE